MAVSDPAKELFDTASDALRITGPPHWLAPDQPEEWDILAFVDAPDIDGAPFWALAPGEADVGCGSPHLVRDFEQVRVAEPDTPDLEELVPLDTTMARSLICDHFRCWLLDRGWQIQVSICKSKRIWRLADCLSIADGGGDRLDDDYPFGDDELAVLCASVAVVQRASRYVIPRS